MNQYLKTLLDDYAIAAKRVKAVADAVAGSHITTAMEQHVPGLAGLAEKILANVGLAAQIGAAMPQIEAGIAVVEILAKNPMDANDIAKIDHDKSKDMP